jgi:ATP-dependent DNA helicase PIF1
MSAFNPLFADWVLDIGNGISDPIINLLEHNTRFVHSLNALMHATFGIILNESTLPHLTRHVILSPFNKNTDLFNEEILKIVAGPSIIRYSIDRPFVERVNHPLAVPEEYLFTLSLPRMPPYRLCLKIIGVYMLLRNMNVSDGLCNGTGFTLTKIDGYILTCRILHDDKFKKEKTFLLSRITTKPPPQYPFPFNRRQYPIRPCFGMTINKRQGGTFDMVGLDATTPDFCHG